MGSEESELALTAVLRSACSLFTEEVTHHFFGRLLGTDVPHPHGLDP